MNVGGGAGTVVDLISAGDPLDLAGHQVGAHCKRETHRVGCERMNPSTNQAKQCRLTQRPRDRFESRSSSRISRRDASRRYRRAGVLWKRTRTLPVMGLAIRVSIASLLLVLMGNRIGSGGWLN